MNDGDSNPAGEGQPANPVESTGETQGGSRDSGSDAVSAQLRRTQKALDKANQRIADFDKQQAEKAAAELSDVDRYKAENEQYKRDLSDLQAKAAEKDKQNAFRFAAKEAGVVDVSAALKLADLSMLDFDGDQVVGVDAALGALKKSSPYLFGSPAPSTGSGGGANPSGGAPQGRTLSAKQLGAMSTAEYAKVKPLIASGEIKLIP